MRERILVVDDDPAICDLVRLDLEAEGYMVTTAADGETALRFLKEERFQLVILDLMLPGLDGLEVARLARQASDLPILILSARDSEVDVAVGLGVGADDYLTKPFRPLELAARVKAHLRRYRGGSKNEEGEILEAGPVRLNITAHRAWLRGEEVSLTVKEFELLRLFTSHPGRVFTKDQIFEAVWGENYLGTDNTVMVHIRRLRAKVEENPEQPGLIRTVWGIGYRFEEPSP